MFLKWKALKCFQNNIVFVLTGFVAISLYGGSCWRFADHFQVIQITIISITIKADREFSTRRHFCNVLCILNSYFCRACLKMEWIVALICAASFLCSLKRVYAMLLKKKKKFCNYKIKNEVPVWLVFELLKKSWLTFFYIIYQWCQRKNREF